MKSKISENVSRVFLSFCLIFYLVPFVVNLVLFDQHDLLYRNADKYFYVIIIIPFLLTVWLFDKLIPKIKFNFLIIQPIRAIISNSSFNLLLSFIFLSLSLTYVLSGFGLDFRQRETISESAGFLKIFFLLKSYFLGFITLLFIKSLNSHNSGFTFILINLNILLSLLMTINSSFDIVYIFVIISIIFEVKDLYFTNNEKIVTSFIFGILKVLLIAFLLILLIFVGVANKLGSDIVLSQVFDIDFVVLLFSDVILRLSTWYVSLINVSHLYFSGYDTSIGFFAEFQNIGQNFIKLLGGKESSLPEIWSVSRYNYLNIFNYNELPRAGASPGLVASIFYFPNPFIGYFCILGYIIFVLRTYTHYLRNLVKKFSFFGIIIMIFLLLPLVDAPLQFINPINPQIIYYIVFFTNFKT